MNWERALRADADCIIRRAIAAVLPDEAVRRALAGRRFDDPVTILSIGKAAWRMASAACEALGDSVRQGVVVTKYGHSEGALPPLAIYEAGHPVPDAGSVRAARAVMDMAGALGEGDAAVLLISGGGSALFEYPQAGLTLADIADITGQLLAAGADIAEINCIRKRLSAVKGGRLGRLIYPARALAVLLSDVLGDRPDVIASGPAYPDRSDCAFALDIARRYKLRLSDEAWAALRVETPKELPFVETVLAGNVSALCEAARQAAADLGYNARVVDAALSCEADDAGRMLASLALAQTPPAALIFGGETVVRVRGDGKGGRSQQLALAAAEGLSGLPNACVFAVGSDGTDGPTDAAGGIVTGDFFEKAGAERVRRHLANNDAYPLLKETGALIQTGPTGTNVNDLYVLLVK